MVIVGLPTAGYSLFCSRAWELNPELPDAVGALSASGFLCLLSLFQRRQHFLETPESGAAHAVMKKARAVEVTARAAPPAALEARK
jgi:hypothetical protein